MSPIGPNVGQRRIVVDVACDSNEARRARAALAQPSKGVLNAVPRFFGRRSESGDRVR